MNKYKMMLKDYDILKNEISRKTEIHNSLMTFMIKTVVVILDVTMIQELPLF